MFSCLYYFVSSLLCFCIYLYLLVKNIVEVVACFAHSAAAVAHNASALAAVGCGNGCCACADKKADSNANTADYGTC
jgi:hypothetical protein